MLKRLKFVVEQSSSSSRMRVIYHNWSATKQRPHPQSVADISHHSVLSGDRIRQCETLSGSRHKDTVSVAYGMTANVAGAAIQNFRIGPSLSNRIESNVRLEFESNLEASQVPSFMLTNRFYLI